MSGNKTVANAADVQEFIAGIEHETRRADALVLLEMMQRISGEPATMWGGSIVGFGSYHYKYESGREGDMFKVGFSPRKASMSVYIISGFSEYGHLMEKLGKHKTGRSCLYINKLSDIDLGVLEQLIGDSLDYINNKYPNSG